ncbi:MAG: protein adenylyltransferase SelO family protein [Polyangiaceae bacterium]
MSGRARHALRPSPAEPGAIVCRVAPSFVRFGNFEIFAARDDVSLLKRYLDTVLTTSSPSSVRITSDVRRVLPTVTERTPDPSPDQCHSGWCTGS